MTDKRHYIITSEVMDYQPSHVYAENRALAIASFLAGDNCYGYNEDFFRETTILVVRPSDVDEYYVEEVEVPAKVQLEVRKVGALDA